MKLHHIGCATRDLERTLASYTGMLASPRCSRVFDVASQQVEVCFVELQPGVFLELVRGTGETSPVERYYKAGFYHLCFLVDDLDRHMATLAPGMRPLPAFASEAFGGKRCQFVVTPDSQLLEFAEISEQAFEAWFAANLQVR